MISLRPMRDSEFLAYLDYFIPDYASEIASNYRLSDNESLAQAKQEIASDLPDGVDTIGHVLLCVIDPTGTPEKLIGYLWYKQDPTMRAAFISDFHIFPAYQGQGLGKQALEVLENDLKRKGFQQIKLRVAGDNKRARHVYEVTGFQVTGINMSKPLVSK
ncbi:GNAT family N-acetyltransferase [Mesorhizobium sp. M0293]|uniref:GNAT family N-acetyltransferase n=1 Tax=unclassified Mesorhizobium TaxID=325217 RepID=UPI00333C390E